MHLIVPPAGTGADAVAYVIVKPTVRNEMKTVTANASPVVTVDITPGNVMIGLLVTCGQKTNQKDWKEKMDNTSLARFCHEMNRKIQELIGEEPSPVWEEAPRWQRDSAITGVNKAKAGFTSEELHESWLSHKLHEGWTFGNVKDEVLKTHPCMVPYSELSPEQKLKDAVFKAVVEYLA